MSTVDRGGYYAVVDSEGASHATFPYIAGNGQSKSVACRLAEAWLNGYRYAMMFSVVGGVTKL